MSAQIPSSASPDSELGRLQIEIGELLKAERFDEAIPLLIRASEQQPDDARTHFMLGKLHFDADRFEPAVPPLRRALAINPNIGIAHWHLGAALQMLGDSEGAIQALERAVQIRPDITDAQLRLAALYRSQGRAADARECYLTAAQHTDEPAEQKLLEAQALLEERHEAEAEALLRSALEIDPRLPSANGLLGQILTVSGRFNEAARHFQAEIAQSPQTVLAYYDLVRSRKMTEEDSGILRQIDSALEEQKLRDIGRAILLLARGKMLDDLGRYEEAMQALDRAAVLRARAFAIDMDAFEAKIDSIIGLFSAETIAACTSGNASRVPVLIAGMPRSGTTLVEQILSCHPQSAAGEELTYWTKRLDMALTAGREGLTAEFLRSSAAEYGGQLHKISSRASRVSDKNPFNFLALGLIHMAFPAASIVHCRRDAVDTALSIHQTHFSRATGLPTGGEDLVRYFRGYRRLMAHWRNVLPKGRMFEMRYERLTSSPQTEVRQLLAYLGLPWDAACLTPHLSTKLVRTPSGYQVRQSINTDSVDRWRRYEPWLGPLAALIEEPGQSAGA